MNKYRTRIVPAIAAIIIILGPLVISQVVVYGYLNPKLFAIELGLALVISYALFLFPLNVYTKAMQQPVVWGIGLFLLSFLASTFASIDKTTSWFGNIDRGTGTFFIAIVSIAAVVLGSVLHKNQARKYILIPISISGVLVSLSIYAEELGWKVLGTGGRAGFLGNSSVAGTYLLISFFVTLYLFLSSTTRRSKLLHALSALAIIANTVFINFSFFRNPSESLFGVTGEAKGATVSVVFGLVVVLTVWLITARQQARKIAGAAFLGLIVIGTVIGVVQLVQPQSRLHAWFVAQETDVRFVYWNAAMEGFDAHKALGTGPETYSYTYQKYFDPIVMLRAHSGEIWSNKPHDAYVETLSERGAFGAVAYLALLIGLFVSVIRIYKKDGDRNLLIVVSGLVAAYLLNNSIFFDTVTSYFLIFMVLAYVIAVSPYTYEESTTNVVASIVKYILGAVVILGVVIIIVPQIIKTHRGYKEFKLPLDQRATYYQKVENTASYGSSLFIGQRADFYYESVFSPNLNLILQQNEGNRKIAVGAIQGIIDTLKNSFKQYPKNEQGELAMAKLASIKMVILNAPDADSLATMKAAAQDAIALAPNNPNGYIMLGQEDVYEQKYDDAYAQFEHARVMEPQLAQAQFALVNLANMLRDQKRVQFYLQRGQQESPDFKKATTQ